jgi:uncharacterized cupin superfamily protein
MPELTPPQPTLQEGYTHPVLGGGLGDYSHVVLGELGELTQFGVHLEILPAGGQSSFRPWHEAKDELIYMLSGEVVLIEDHETLLQAGDVACWPARVPMAHYLMKRRQSDACYLTVGTRLPKDVVHDSDHDLIAHKDGRQRRYFHADGQPRAAVSQDARNQNTPHSPHKARARLVPNATEPCEEGPKT